MLDLDSGKREVLQSTLIYLQNFNSFLTSETKMVYKPNAPIFIPEERDMVSICALEHTENCFEKRNANFKENRNPNFSQNCQKADNTIGKTVVTSKLIN